MLRYPFPIFLSLKGVPACKQAGNIGTNQRKKQQKSVTYSRIYEFISLRMIGRTRAEGSRDLRQHSTAFRWPRCEWCHQIPPGAGDRPLPALRRSHRAAAAEAQPAQCLLHESRHRSVRKNQNHRPCRWFWASPLDHVPDWAYRLAESSANRADFTGMGALQTELQRALMNHYGVPNGTNLKSFSPENTTIIHYSSAKRLHYSSFIKGLLQFCNSPKTYSA